MMQSAGIVVNDVTVTWRNGHTALRCILHSTKWIYCRSGWGKRFRKIDIV